MKSLKLMITFFTRIPISYKYKYDEKDFIKGIKLLPIVGLIVGLFLYAPTLLESYIHRPILILGVWSIYLFITGGLHIDGLADTVDGIFSYRKKEEMLNIMKDSRVGTFGAIIIFWLLLINLFLTYYLENVILIFVPIVGRICALLSASISTYARKEGGMGAAFIKNCGIKEVLLGIIFTFICGFIFDITFIIIPLGLTLAAVILITKNIEKKLGGTTGDTIGAVVEISQSLFMFFYYLFIIKM